jgi:bacterioferritin (cytochrome b1)
MLSLKVSSSQVDKYAEKVWEHVQKQLTRVINGNGLRKTKKRKRIKLLPKEKTFLNSINTEEKIKEILTADLPKLRSLIEEFEEGRSYLRIKSNSLNRILYNVFVSNIYEIKDKFDGLKFVEDLELQTCPYCNRAFIQSVKRNGIVRPQIDHFYPKSLYPYLGLSFYNLIPSCSVCNGTTVKGEQDSYKDGLVSPYEVKYNDFKFGFKSTGAESFEVKFDKRLSINDTYFKLEDFYKHHSDVVHELYIKIKKENTKEHFDLLAKSLDMDGFDMADVYKFLTCGYLNEEDFHRRPLSKLTRDISEKLGLKIEEDK